MALHCSRFVAPEVSCHGNRRLSEDPTRSKSFELELRTQELHRDGLGRKLQGHLGMARRVQEADGAHLALFEALTLDKIPPKPTQV
jgi:hypothetical protein